MTEKRARPGPGQESVWDDPRPPRVETTTRRIQVSFGGEEIADTRGALRVLETTHAPVYDLPREDVRMGVDYGRRGSLKPPALTARLSRFSLSPASN